MNLKTVEILPLTFWRMDDSEKRVSAVGWAGRGPAEARARGTWMLGISIE